MVSIEKPRDELFTSEERIFTASFINLRECLLKINSFECSYGRDWIGSKLADHFSLDDNFEIAAIIHLCCYLTKER